MKNLVTFLVLSTLLSCREQDKGLSPYADIVLCGTKNPAQNIPWLRTRIEQLNVGIVQVATFNGETYIDLYAYHWSCMGCHIYRCDGSLVDLSQLSATDKQELFARLWPKEPFIIYKRS